MHFMHFLMINAHVWQINFEKFMFNTEKWNKNIGNKELLDHVLPFEAKNNFLTFLRMEMTCFSCKKMHRIFQDSLRTANICEKNKKMMQFQHFSVDLSTKQQLLRMQHALFQ